MIGKGGEQLAADSRDCAGGHATAVVHDDKAYEIDGSVQYRDFYPGRVAVADRVAEEIVQEAFLLLFRPLRAEKRRDNLQGWLFGVAHNLALKHFTRVRREAGGDAALTDHPDVEPDPEERLQMLELQHDLLAVVRALPEQDQRCLSLRAEGLRYRDIARILGISLGSVANSVSRSLSRLSRGSTGRSFTDAR